MPKKTKLTREITDSLTWSRHTAITAGKANRVLGFLRRNINDCSTKVKAISYITMVRPIMEHGSAAWDPHLQKDISQLESVQRRAARFCCGDYTSRTPGCVDYMLSLLHKINSGHVGITIDQYLQRSEHRTREAQRFRHARADHPAFYHSFFLQQLDRGIGSPQATTCPEAFRAGLRALTSALISS